MKLAIHTQLILNRTDEPNLPPRPRRPRQVQVDDLLFQRGPDGLPFFSVQRYGVRLDDEAELV